MRDEVLLAAQEPESTTRLSLTGASLSKEHEVSILMPKFRARFRPRFLSAALRYAVFAFQELLASTDILHLVNSPDFIHLPALVKRCDVVYDYRSNYSDKLRLSYPSLAGTAASLEEMLAKRANLILTVNDILAVRFGKRVGKPVVVVPNYPTRDFRSTIKPEATRTAHGFSGESLALFVGNLTDTYDLDLLLASARKLTSMEFWIVGSGKNEIQLRAKSTGNVKFMGKVPHSVVPDLIAAADVCLAPIRAYQADIVHNDQDVWKITEYAALGKPIVATNLAPSSQYELVRGEVDAFSEAIKRACSGMIRPAQPRFWEDMSEPPLLEAYRRLR
ncbi:MAG TPA: glycosyltransferase [Thermoproteota archaeon]|nr:glycosyltransferase [Thermoproteota archaeon]